MALLRFFSVLPAIAGLRYAAKPVSASLGGLVASASLVDDRLYSGAGASAGVSPVSKPSDKGCGGAAAQREYCATAAQRSGVKSQSGSIKAQSDGVKTADAAQRSGGGLSGTGTTGGASDFGSVCAEVAQAAADVQGSAAEARHAVVIGAGIAGLSAAWELQRRGWRVTVLEQADQVGGAVRTVQREGWQVECGPNTMMVTSREFEEMIASLGLEDKIVRPGTSFKKRFLVRNGQLHAGPASFGEFARTPLFSTGAKLRLFWNLVWGGGRRKDLEDESLGSYFRRQFGREVVDVAIRPVITGVYAGDADRLSLRHAFPFVWEAAKRSRSVLRGVVGNLMDKRKSGTGFRNYMISFEGGLQTLPQTLAAALTTAPLTGVRVTAVSAVEGGRKWRVAYGTGSATGDTRQANGAGRESVSKQADGTLATDTQQANGLAETVSVPTEGTANAEAEIIADALVLAPPSFAVAQLPLPPELLQALAPLEQVEYPPLANVALGYRREQVTHPLDGFGAVVSEKEKAQVLGVLFSSSVYPQTAPDGHVLLTCFIGGTRAPGLAALPQAELVRHTHAQLRDLLGVSGKPVFANTVYWPRAIPQVTVGYGQVLGAVDAAEAAYPSLAIVGNYRGEIALGKCAADSVLRARALDERLRPAVG